MRQHNRWLLANTCRVLSKAGQATCSTNRGQVSLALFDVLVCLFPTSANVHARSAALRRDVQLHFVDVNEGLSGGFAIFLSITTLAVLLLGTHFIDLGDKGVSQ